MIWMPTIVIHLMCGCFFLTIQAKKINLIKKGLVAYLVFFPYTLIEKNLLIAYLLIILLSDWLIVLFNRELLFLYSTVLDLRHVHGLWAIQNVYRRCTTECKIRAFLTLPSRWRLYYFSKPQIDFSILTSSRYFVCQKPPLWRSNIVLYSSGLRSSFSAKILRWFNFKFSNTVLSTLSLHLKAWCTYFKIAERCNLINVLFDLLLIKQEFEAKRAPYRINLNVMWVTKCTKRRWMGVLEG